MALFAGAGGGILGGHLLGWRTVCAVEWEPYPASVLAARQNDGIFPPFPIWDDIQTFDGRPWRGIVDVVSGGFPCQDISAAGKGAGIDGERSGMWREMARVIHEVRPRFVFVENSPMLTSRGLGTVLGDLASMGFDARWGVLGAADVGAPHQRDRIWIVGHSRIRRHGAEEKEICPRRNTIEPSGEYLAHTKELLCDGSNDHPRKLLGRKQVSELGNGSGEEDVSDTDSPQCQGNKRSERSITKRTNACKPSWWEVEPDVGRVADGVAARVDRLKAIGNGQVSEVARRAWEELSELHS